MEALYTTVKFGLLEMAEKVLIQPRCNRFDLLIRKLDGTPAQKEELKTILEQNQSSKLCFLLIGKTGSGKSTICNALIGAEVAKVGNTLDPETSEVTSYEMDVKDGFKVIVWDSPGLQDGTKNELKYLGDMKEKCEPIHMLLYCIDMSETRSDLQETDSSSIKKITDTLGKNVWENAIFVLTQANIVEHRLATKKLRLTSGTNVEFQRKIVQWKTKIHDALLQFDIPKEVVEKVPVEPAGSYLKPQLPDRKHWLGYLWLIMMGRVRNEAKAALLVINEDRLVEEKNFKPEDCLVDQASKAPLVIDKASILSMCLGGFIGGGTASVIGTGVGAAIGAVVIGGATMGIGAGIGIVIGAFAGGAVGTGIGLLIIQVMKKRGEKKAITQ